MQLSNISLAITRLGQRQLQWTPATLFAAGEVGVFYDPSDFSTLFQDASGTTPVTAVEQPVGLMLDKSGRGNHATQATSTKRPVLKQDASGHYYLLFDGVDDALVTNAFSISNPISMFSGVRFNSATAVYVTDSVSGTRLYNLSDGTSRQFGISATMSSGITTLVNTTRVETTVYNAASSIYRLNGAQITTGNTGSGTVSTGLKIGVSQFSTAYLNGHLYSLIIRGAQSTDAQIVSAETYVNGKTNAY